MAARVTQARACAADLVPTPAALQGKRLIKLTALAEGPPRQAEGQPGSSRRHGRR